MSNRPTLPVASGNMARRTSSLTVVCLLLAAGAPRTAHAVGANKAGRFSISAKVGPAAAIDDAPTQVSAQPELLIAVDPDFNAYFGVNPQFQFGGDATFLNFPATFQYDIELPISGVEGLYIYPKISGGIMYLLEAERIFALVEPALGVKFQPHEYFHVALEPLSFPFYFVRYFSAQYQFYVSAGVDL